MKNLPTFSPCSLVFPLSGRRLPGGAKGSSNRSPRFTPCVAILVAGFLIVVEMSGFVGGSIGSKDERARDLFNSSSAVPTSTFARRSTAEEAEVEMPCVCLVAELAEPITSVVVDCTGLAVRGSELRAFTNVIRGYFLVLFLGSTRA